GVMLQECAHALVCALYAREQGVVLCHLVDTRWEAGLQSCESPGALTQTAHRRWPMKSPSFLSPDRQVRVGCQEAETEV
ncbi:hypothetical protein V4Y02_24145, partial [Escherichia coli]